MLKLNIGCGYEKIDGYVNIDAEPKCNPDVVCDIMMVNLPYEDASVDEIVFFHCVEHIRKLYHTYVFEEFRRVLKPGGTLYVSYPNFHECAKRFIANTDANRDFWEATIYGRQLYPTDFHVCAMTPEYLAEFLLNLGFSDIVSKPEPQEPYNSITFARKGSNPSRHYEDDLRDEVVSMKVN